MAQRKRGLRFPAPIEQAYERHARVFRARVVSATIVPSLLIYNLFLVLDYVLLPQTFAVALFCHLAIITPLLLFAGFVVRGHPGLLVRETLSACMPLAMAAQVLFIFHANADIAAAEHYQYLVAGIVAYANVNQRPDFRFALLTTILLIAAYCAVLVAAAIPFPALLTGLTVTTGIGYLTLIANYRMERDLRYAFLRRVHDRLEREHSERAASRDALTGLANRNEFEKRAARLYADDRRAQTQLGVLMVDVDHFKDYNDHYGHPAGDTCLKRIGGAIAAQLRHANDLAIRYGGEEFLILLYEADLDDAIRIAERLRRTIESFRIPHVAGSGHVTVSLGAGTGRIADVSVEALIAEADAALYEAKRAGRNRVSPPLLADSRSASVHAIRPRS